MCGAGTLCGRLAVTPRYCSFLDSSSTPTGSGSGSGSSIAPLSYLPLATCLASEVVK